jgi:hypothetical protein
VIQVYSLGDNGQPAGVIEVDDVEYVAAVLAAEFNGVPREIRHLVKTVPIPASQAQAVAILSYARNVNQRRPLWPNARDQCYMPDERPATDATRAIAGEMACWTGINHEGDVGRPASMHYARCCGGHSDADGHVGKSVPCVCQSTHLLRQGHGWGGCQIGMMLLGRIGLDWRQIVFWYWNVDLLRGTP